MGKGKSNRESTNTGALGFEATLWSAAENKQKQEEANRQAEAIKQKAQADADRQADEIKKKAQEDVGRDKAEAKRAADAARNATKAQPTPTNSPSGPDPQDPWPNQTASTNRPSPAIDPLRKGGEALIQSLNAVEIQKSAVGTFDSDGRLEAILVVRDTQFPNASLQILS